VEKFDSMYKVSMSLSPSDTLALVQLRALLDQAKRAAASSAEAGRLTALVLLDAVNERVTHLAAQTLPGVAVGSRDQFADMYSKIKAALGASWRINTNGWTDVRKLHQARNAAQHEGISGDPVSFPGWVIATERYTDSLVSATFDIDLNEVFFADAIRDPDSASQLRQAEVYLLAGDSHGSISEVEKAFRSALQAWSNFHDQAVGSRPSTGFRDLDGLFAKAYSASAAHAFASDIGEYVWYSELVKGDHGHVTLEEARRALVFVFWWLVRWETMSDSLVTSMQRRERWLTAEIEKKTRKSEIPARVDRISVTSMRSTSDSVSYRVFLEVVGIPRGEVERLQWSVAVQEGLSELRDRFQIWSSLDGVYNITMDISESHEPGDLVREVRSILRNAELEWRQSYGEYRARIIEQEEEDQRLARDFESMRDEFPVWVTGISYSREIVGGEMVVGLDLHLSDRIRGYPGEIHALISAHEEIESLIWKYNAVNVVPKMDVGRLARVFSDIDTEVQELIESARRDEEYRKSQLEEVRLAFDRALSMEEPPAS
jgi:hypothetical protein